MTTLEKQLIVLSSRGIIITHADGHRWINALREDEIGFEFYFDFDKVLKEHGISLNNKIYGGVLDAISVIEKAWILIYGRSLESEFDMQFDSDWDIVNQSKTTENRIDVVDKGKGGLV